jgi:hypothetical protein
VAPGSGRGKHPGRPLPPLAAGAGF